MGSLETVAAEYELQRNMASRHQGLSEGRQLKISTRNINSKTHPTALTLDAGTGHLVAFR